MDLYSAFLFWTFKHVGKSEPPPPELPKEISRVRPTRGSFVKKPVVIDAAQWDGSAERARDIVEWSRGAVTFIPYQPVAQQSDLMPSVGTPARLIVHTLEGDMEVAIGDWVIQGIVGEFYPCKPDIFDATYDHIEEEKDDDAAS